MHTDVGNHGGRLQDQRQDRAAGLGAQQRRRGRDHHLEGAVGAAGGLGIDRRHRQGAAAIRRATRDAVRDAIRRARPAHRRAAVPARQDANIPTRSCTGALPRLARASIDEVFVGGRSRRDAAVRRRARHVPRLQGGACRHDRAAAEVGERLVRAQEGEGGEVQGADGRASGAAIPIRGINTDLPVRFAPNGGAVPGDRIVGILTPGEGITIYPIQSPALKDFEDTPERWLDRALGYGRAHAAAVSGADRGADPSTSRASLAQVAQVIAEHDGNIDNIRMERRVAGLHLGHDRSRGLRPQASQLDHRAIARQGRGGERRAGERLSADDIISDAGKRRARWPRTAPRRQHRPRRDHPQRARRAASRSGARGQARDRGRAPTASPRICARTAATSATTTSRGSRRRSPSRSISKWRRPTRWSISRSRPDRTPPAWCRSGATSARPKAASTSPVSTMPLAPQIAATAGGRHPRFAVHRRRAAADRGGGGDRRAGDRDPYRRLVRRARRPSGCGGAEPNGSGSATARNLPGASASKFTPATVSISRLPRRSPRCRKSSNSISVTS